MVEEIETRDWPTVKAVAETLGVSRSSIERAIDNGHLKALNVSLGKSARRFRIDPASVKKLKERAS